MLYVPNLKIWWSIECNKKQYNASIFLNELLFLCASQSIKLKFASWDLLRKLHQGRLTAVGTSFFLNKNDSTSVRTVIILNLVHKFPLIM